MRHVAAMLVAWVVLGGVADAAVLCVKPRKSGELNGAVKIRTACRAGEVQIAPEDVGFCCTQPPSSSSTSTSVTTTSSTTGSCPIDTSTTLGIPDCFGGTGACLGLCANARACEHDPQTGGCACVGAVQPCGIVTASGMCGGSCPGGATCQYYGAPGADGCPGEPHCACVPQ
jgi:hypothetical protein